MTDPTGWPSVCKCGATAVSPCNRSPCFRGERDPGRIYNEADVAAALAQARRETWKAANEAAEDVFLLIPPKDMSLGEQAIFKRGYSVAKNAIIAAIRAKAQESTP
jgi:hypothetical protein